MKNTLSTLVLLFISTVGLLAQTDTSKPMFKDAKLGAAYGTYVSLKDALVASKGDAAKEAAAKLQTTLSVIKNSEKASEQAGKVASAADLNTARKAFATLSTEMASLVKGGQLSAGALYLEYCPMANNNTGAYWLSNEKEIKNPYFGDKMLKCGSVKETIQ